MKEVIIIIEMYRGEEKEGESNYNLMINGVPKGYVSRKDVLKLIDQEINQEIIQNPIQKR